MRARALGVILALLLPGVGSAEETAPSVADSLEAWIPEEERRFAELETSFAAAVAEACAGSAASDVRCIEAETLAEVAEQLLQEGEAALAVEMLQEAVLLLGTRDG
jgi:hypothetical protein